MVQKMELNFNTPDEANSVKVIFDNAIQVSPT